MFDHKFIVDAAKRSGETTLDRRRLLAMAGIAGVTAAGAMVGGDAARAADPAVTDAAAGAPSDASVLNFALNLEYLEAEFYLRAVTGSGLSDDMVTGTGTPGAVTGGRKVPFKTAVIRKYAEEIASDEKQHVAFLRAALGSAAVSRPAISLDASFTAAATAAGLIKPGQTFDPYANELNFLFAAFLFEDVGVTAYKGAAPFIENKTFLEAAAGLLAVEAYHAGIIRTVLYGAGIVVPSVFSSVEKISGARDSLDGATDLDQGIGTAAMPNLIPTDDNGLAFSRTTGQVLNIVYLNPGVVTSGGFYPAGVNGPINTSG
jgi:hypothetical protein